jgi:hypothetical protein
VKGATSSSFGNAAVVWPLAVRARSSGAMPRKTLGIITERRATDFP